MVSLWPWKVRLSIPLLCGVRVENLTCLQPGRGQLPSALREDARRSFDQDQRFNRAFRHPPSECPPFQSSLDAIHHLRVPPLLDHLSSRPWLAELGNCRILCCFWWASSVRNPLMQNITFLWIPALTCAGSTSLGHWPADSSITAFPRRNNT